MSAVTLPCCWPCTVSLIALSHLMAVLSGEGGRVGRKEVIRERVGHCLARNKQQKMAQAVTCVDCIASTAACRRWHSGRSLLLSSSASLSLIRASARWLSVVLCRERERRYGLNMHNQCQHQSQLGSHLAWMLCALHCCRALRPRQVLHEAHALSECTLPPMLCKVE